MPKANPVSEVVVEVMLMLSMRPLPAVPMGPAASPLVNSSDEATIE